jgi:DNA-binding transcriptional LysR family regulator
MVGLLSASMSLGRQSGFSPAAPLAAADCRVLPAGDQGERTGSCEAAALSGQGIALLPQIMIAADLRTGRLIRVLEQYMVERSAVRVIYPSRRLSLAVRSFVEFAVSRFSSLQQRDRRIAAPDGESIAGSPTGETRMIDPLRMGGFVDAQQNAA